MAGNLRQGVTRYDQGTPLPAGPAGWPTQAPVVSADHDPVALIRDIAACLRAGSAGGGAIAQALWLLRDRLHMTAITVVPGDGEADVMVGQAPATEQDAEERGARQTALAGAVTMASTPTQCALWLAIDTCRLPGWLLCCRRPSGALFTARECDLLEAAVAVLAGWLDRARLQAQVRDAEEDSLRGLAAALASRDRYTGSHVDAVRLYADRLAQRLGLDAEARAALNMGSILHDIGKIGMNDEILRKAGPLSDVELRQMKLHPTIGAQIVNRVRRLQPALPVVLHHHERWDGQGYPSGLRGEEIPLLARIVTVVDSFHSMTSDRPYRKALSDVEAMHELRCGAGAQFDPAIVDAFIGLLLDLESIAG